MAQHQTPTQSAEQLHLGNRLAVGNDQAQRTLWVCAESKRPFRIQENSIEDFFRIHETSQLACRSAAELLAFARAAGEEAAGQAIWKAVTAGWVIDLRLRDHAAALAREGLTAKPRRWANIVDNHTDLRPDLVDSDAGKPPLGERAAVALWKIAYEPRPQLGNANGMLVAGLHVAASIILDGSFFSPLRVDPGRLPELLLCLQRRRDRLVGQLITDQRIRKCFKLTDGGTVEFTNKGFAVWRDGSLRPWLKTFDRRLRDQVGQSVAAPRVGNKISIAPVHWIMLAPLDDMLAAWVELDAVCRLADDLNSTPGKGLSIAYAVLPWIRATNSDLSDLQDLAGHGLIRPPPDRVWLHVDLIDLHIAALANSWEETTGRSSLADLIRGGQRVSEWAASRYRGMAQDQFRALAETNPAEYVKWNRLAGRLYFAAGLGLPAAAGHNIARRIALDDDFIREAGPCLGRLYEDLHPDVADYLRRIPDPDRALDVTWAATTSMGLEVAKLNCLSARKAMSGTKADYVIQLLLVTLAENGYRIVAVTEEDLLIELGPNRGADVTSFVQELVDRVITQVFEQFAIQCRVNRVASC